MRLIEFSFKRSFADCKAILLMTCKKRTFPSITTEKCPIHINIFVAYLLHMCCIRCKFQHIWQLSTTSVTLVKWAFLDICVLEILSLTELWCSTSCFETVFLTLFHSRISCEESCCLENWSVICISLDEGS